MSLWICFSTLHVQYHGSVFGIIVNSTSASANRETFVHFQYFLTKHQQNIREMLLTFHTFGLVMLASSHLSGGASYPPKNLKYLWFFCKFHILQTHQVGQFRDFAGLVMALGPLVLHHWFRETAWWASAVHMKYLIELLCDMCTHFHS